MPLTCPQCAVTMNEVGAPATVGYCIVLDQCSCCGGIWCDRWELYPLTPAAADRLDVDQPALQQPTAPPRAPLECPRCRARLRRFDDPSLPHDACIWRCPNCDGMWLNRGELRRFKHRDLSRGTPSSPITDAQLDRLARDAAPVSHTAPVHGLAYAFDADESAADAADIRKNILSSASWLIARAALRLLLHV